MRLINRLFKLSLSALLALFVVLLFPISASANHPNTPTNLSASVSSERNITITWTQAAAVEGQYKPERYAIGFGMNSSWPYGVATGNVGGANSLNTTYTFTCNYLKQVFQLDDCVGSFNFKVRADNDTNSVYSGWSTAVSVTLTTPVVSQAEYDALNAQYQALQTNYNQLKSSYDSLQASYDELKTAYINYQDSAKAQIEQDQITIAGYIKKVDSLTESLATKSAELEDKVKELATAQESIATLKADLEDANFKLGIAEDNFATVSKELKDALTSLAKSKSDYELEKAKSADLGKQLAASKARVEELEAKLADVTKRLDDMTAKQGSTQKELEAARATIESLKAQLTAANATIDEQKKKIEDLQAILNNPKAEQNLALAEEVKEIAMAKFQTSEKDSEEYLVALELLAVAAEADDPDLAEEIAVIPVVGAVAEQVLEVMNDLGNIGADIAPEQRERAEEIVVASVIAGNVAASAGASAASGARRKVE